MFKFVKKEVTRGGVQPAAVQQGGEPAGGELLRRRVLVLHHLPDFARRRDLRPHRNNHSARRDILP